MIYRSLAVKRPAPVRRAPLELFCFGWRAAPGAWSKRPHAESCPHARGVYHRLPHWGTPGGWLDGAPPAAPPLPPRLRAPRCSRGAADVAVVSPDLAGAPTAPPRPGHLLAVLWVHLLGVWPLGVTLGVAAARWTRRMQAPHHSRRAPLSLQMRCTRPAGTSGRGRVEEGGRLSVCIAAPPKPPVWGMTWRPGRAPGRAG
jgi:hypothetical protein